MFCNQCGTQVPDNATVCSYCGATLKPIQNTDISQGVSQPAGNTAAGQLQSGQVQNMGANQIPNEQQQNIGAGTGYGQSVQPGIQQPDPRMYYGTPMQGYPAPAQSPVANFGTAFKNAPGEFAGKVKRMGISMFCLLGIIAAMLFLVAPFMNFVSIHVNEKIEVPSYRYGLFGQYDDDYNTDVKLKAGIGFDLFELSQLSGTVERLADQLGAMDTDEIADTLESAEDYIVREMEEELDTDIKNSSIKEVFGTATLILKGRIATLITPWILILCGAGLLVFSVVNNRKLKFVFSLIPLLCLIWLMICSGHFFSIMGIGAWAMILGIVLGLISAIKDGTGK